MSCSPSLVSLSAGIFQSSSFCMTTLLHNFLYSVFKVFAKNHLGFKSLSSDVSIVLLIQGTYHHKYIIFILIYA